MPAITSTNVAEAIPKIIALEVLQALQPNFLMASLVNRDYQSVFADAGDTVNVPIAPLLSASNMIESGTVTPQNPSMGSAQIVLDSHVVAGFQIPDVTRAIAQPDLIRVYMQSAILAIAERIETDILANYAGFTVNAAVGGTSAIDEARLDLAETNMFNSRVPDTQPKYLILSGTAYGELRQLPRITEFQTGIDRGQPSPIQTGIMATRVKNFTAFRSQLVPKVSSTTYNLAFSRDALALVVRPLQPPMAGTGAIGTYAELGGFSVRVVMSYQHGMLGQMVTVDCLYGTGILRPAFGQIVLSD